MTTLIPNAIYRFTRTNHLRYYRAARTRSGIDFLYPISLDGSRMADTSKDGREYVLVYLLTPWGKLAAGGYWLNPRRAFEKIYVSDATPADLELVVDELAELPAADQRLDNILNRDEIELDVDVWGSLFEEEPNT